MVVTAEHDHVVQIGGAAVDPVLDVVRFGCSRRPVASWERAHAITSEQCGADVGGCGSFRPADIQ
ncbi:hypothetical protein AB0L88_07465, partial [Saccharopolyspora shandongensis]|uniref:hypothetical protein n=1 Tax=Saccharopolyspora shandongensis TaxID=418495 RepID=UPI0034176C0E